ncbi:hypothetical protein OHA84_05255 [Streptomyces sp. NBC_00513]|uniref:hypothetical protein n=1 Tax=unclassified Streptomyces TaxID=2593676 RepID=UPI00225B2202|nr:hypothetical protein [Streptomyces sp. NBC_00424]MCX5077044.1 hypothetical protein [Streptomyces sp. NBC_00424]WUD39954.1 hypothetical protein OHA84_05255 [Streptomyces sp. NBC_00513]
MTDSAAVVGALRELARERAGEVEVLDGFTDSEMDAWRVEVPEALRAVLREIGGVRTGESEFVFGPRGRQVFTDGHWTLGDLDYGEGSLIVGAGTGDWGPVVAVFPHRADDPEVTVEAPEFVRWLTGFAERLAEGAERPVPGTFVKAVPSVAVAEGPDSELAALVGGGDPLTDLVDLRALPAYPCGVGWEPYFSTLHGTADTSGSDVRFRLVGDGRALLLHSVVSGDFLGRPVRRHASPEDAPHRAVAELRALAAEFPSYVVLEAGSADSVMDGWPVPVPEDVRVVLREFGSVTVTGLPTLWLRPGGDALGVDPELHRMLGGDGTYWPLAGVRYGRGGALVQIRIDPEAGQWGYAVSVPADPAALRRYPEVKLLAESPADLLLDLVRRVRRAAGGPDFAARIAGVTQWLFPNTGEPWPRPTPVSEWAGSTDPLLAAAVAELPDGAYAADLREVPLPSDLCFHRAREWPYSARLDRLHFPAGGRLAAAVPVQAVSG